MDKKGAFKFSYTWENIRIKEMINFHGEVHSIQRHIKQIVKRKDFIM